MNKKVIALTAVTVISLSTLAPIGQVFAMENNSNIALSQKQEKTYDELYSMLTNDKKVEFTNLLKQHDFTWNEKIQLLQSHMQANENSEVITQKNWKITLLKKAIKYAARLIGAKLGEKKLTDFVNYLTGFEDNIQQGLENGMVKFFHVNRNTARWVAKTVVFIFF